MIMKLNVSNELKSRLTHFDRYLIIPYHGLEILYYL